jgi:hypothetical protein
MNRLVIIGLSVAQLLTSVPSAMALPALSAPKIDTLKAQPIQYRRYRGGYYRGHHHHHGGDGWGWALGGLAVGTLLGGALAQPGYYGSSYYGPRYYGSGYYGPTYYRPRYYAPTYRRQVYYGGDAHTRWCYARYRSYRSYDDTFQPYYGPRQRCVSPYY